MVKMFQPAEQIAKRLKIYVWGESGSGKTWFALGAPDPIALIDTEGGSDLYGGRFKFDRLSTKSYQDTMQALKEVPAGGYKTLIVDPITVIYQSLIGGRLEYRRQRATDKENVGLVVQDWGDIKRKYAMLLTELINLPCHVIVTARQSDLYEAKAGGDIQKIGVKPDTDKTTDYVFDEVLRMEPAGEGERIAVILKDRSSTYKTGQRVQNPTFDSLFGAVIGVVTKGKETKQRGEDDTAAKDAEAYRLKHLACEGEDCGAIIAEAIDEYIRFGGKQYLPADYAKASREHWGAVLCAKCAEKAKAEKVRAA